MVKHFAARTRTSYISDVSVTSLSRDVYCSWSDSSLIVQLLMVALVLLVVVFVINRLTARGRTHRTNYVYWSWSHSSLIVQLLVVALVLFVIALIIDRFNVRGRTRRTMFTARGRTRR